MLHPLVTCALVANVGAFAYTTVSGLTFDSVAKAYLGKVCASAYLVVSLPKISTGILIVPHKASQKPVDDNCTALVSVSSATACAERASLPNMGRRGSPSVVLPVP